MELTEEPKIKCTENEKALLNWKFNNKKIGKKCWICGRKAAGSVFMQIHHVIPLSEGGIDIPTNTIKLCKECHEKVHHVSNYTEKEWNLRLIKARLIHVFKNEVGWIK